MQLNSITNYHGKQNRSTKRRDDDVDKVRTIFWFEYLAIQIGSRRPRDIQRAISPMMKVDALGGIIKNNKFLGYSRGEHVPRSTIVKKAAALYSDSAVVLNHVLWEVLKAGTLDEERARQLVGQLDPDIQKAVVKSGNHFSDNNRASEMLE